MATNLTDNRKYKFVTRKQGYNPKTGEYMFMTNDMAEPVNFREAYRLPCCYRAVLQIGENRHTADGYTRDISYTGISFTFLTEYFNNVTQGEPVSATLYITDEKTVKVTGRVIRCIPGFAKGMSLIGVRFDPPSPNVTPVIARLQIQEAKVRGRKER